MLSGGLVGAPAAGDVAGGDSGVADVQPLDVLENRFLFGPLDDAPPSGRRGGRDSRQPLAVALDKLRAGCTAAKRPRRR